MGVDQDGLAASLQRLARQVEPNRGVVPALRQVADSCVDLFGVDGSGIMIAGEQDITRYVAATDGPGRVLEQVESATGQGPCTEAFVTGRPVASADLATEHERWPRLVDAVAAHEVRAVLGVPVRFGAVPVGTIDVYRRHAHEWDDSEVVALQHFAGVVETTLTAALQAHTAGELAGQLQYALDYRVVIERAVGFLMAQRGVDAVAAFAQLRRTARSSRTRIGEVAEHLLATGRLPASS